MKEFLKEVWLHVRSSWILGVEAFKLRLAMFLADLKQKARNRRFFVVLMTVGKDKHQREITRLRSIDNEGFKYCKRMGWLPKHMSNVELQQKAFYATPLSRNNTHTREERDKAMKRYMQYQKTINKLRF